MEKPKTNQEQNSGSLRQPCSARSSVFFTADVSETVDYVLDQAAMYKDRSAFVAAVIKKLKPWNEKAPNAAGELRPPQKNPK